MLMFSIWCEWDMGQDNLVFSSKESAIKWCEDNENFKEMFADPDSGVSSVQDCIDNGLLGFNTVELI